MRGQTIRVIKAYSRVKSEDINKIKKEYLAMSHTDKHKKMVQMKSELGENK